MAYHFEGIGHTLACSLNVGMRPDKGVQAAHGMSLARNRAEGAVLATSLAPRSRSCSKGDHDREGGPPGTTRSTTMNCHPTCTAAGAKSTVRHGVLASHPQDASAGARRTRLDGAIRRVGW